MIRLGNVAAREGIRHATGIDWRDIEGKQVTTLEFPAATDPFQDTVAAWDWHSKANPVWIEGDDPRLVKRLAKHFDCQIGRPKDWDTTSSSVTTEEFVT